MRTGLTPTSDPPRAKRHMLHPSSLLLLRWPHHLLEEADASTRVHLRVKLDHGYTLEQTSIPPRMKEASPVSQNRFTDNLRLSAPRMSSSGSSAWRTSRHCVLRASRPRSRVSTLRIKSGVGHPTPLSLLFLPRPLQRRCRDVLILLSGDGFCRCSALDAKTQGGSLRCGMNARVRARTHGLCTGEVRTTRCGLAPIQHDRPTMGAAP